LAGIYIHIPFCRKACHYCNFHFSTSLGPMEAMVGAISKEIEGSGDFLKGQPVNTIYLGGGTPSLLHDKDLERLLRKVALRHPVGEDAEITLEANPDDITLERLEAWKAAGINRLSIGVQSFRDEDLRWMNRTHNAAQATAAIRSARKAGFDHDSIDLIYGTPGLSDEALRENITTVIALGCRHLSCYALTVESKTPLASDIQKGKMPPTDPEQQARQFLLVSDLLTRAGYEHYEISNFALPGHRSRHNSSYWQGVHYLGLGPSAHSFDGRVRRWNISNNAGYIQSLAGGVLPYEEEILTPTQQLNEYIMTSLRTMEGLSLSKVSENWGIPVSDRLVRESRVFREKGWIRQEGEALVLSADGKLFADGIASDLFSEEPRKDPG
jgi:oxygen-independent coproporphyrinogen-3 oxidase